MEQNQKKKKKSKDMLLKDLSPYKIKTIVSDFYLLSSNSLIIQKLYMTLLVHK